MRLRVPLLRDFALENQSVTFSPVRSIGTDFLCFGLPSARIGLLIGHGTRVFCRHSAPTTGTVVDYRNGRSDNGTTMYSPVIE